MSVMSENAIFFGFIATAQASFISTLIKDKQLILKIRKVCRVHTFKYITRYGKPVVLLLSIF